jgi:small neutral amino acid transporter SnatA (MarC family)
MLELIGASLASLAIGGGLVLLLLALAMLNAQPSNIRQTPEEARELENRESAGIVPLAIPLLAGPGRSVPSFSQPSSSGVGCIEQWSWPVSPLRVPGWLVLRLAARIGRALGATGLNVISRLLGLVLAAISIESIATGLKQMFPVLAGGWREKERNHEWHRKFEPKGIVTACRDWDLRADVMENAQEFRTAPSMTACKWRTGPNPWAKSAIAGCRAQNPPLADVVRSEDASMLIASEGDAIPDPEAISALLAELDCPLILMR